MTDNTEPDEQAPPEQAEFRTTLRDSAWERAQSHAAVLGQDHAITAFFTTSPTHRAYVCSCGARFE